MPKEAAETSNNEIISIYGSSELDCRELVFERIRFTRRSGLRRLGCAGNGHGHNNEQASKWFHRFEGFQLRQLGRVGKKCGIHKRRVNAEASQVRGQSQDGMDEPLCAPPFIFRGGTVHVDGIREVQEDE